MKKKLTCGILSCIPINVYQESLICILMGAELVSLTFHFALRKLNTGASHKVAVHLAKQLQRKRFV